MYLVHLMLKSAKFAQGTLENMAVILADNVSRHLKSRLEVERILSSMVYVLCMHSS